MQRIWNATTIEYRDQHGVDRLVQVDLWTDVGGMRAVLVLRDLHTRNVWLLNDEIRAQGRAALETLSHNWLPYLLRPEAQVLVLALHPRESEATKARALVLPLSA